MRHPSHLLIAGTDTAVGKTLITAGLTQWLSQKGCSTVAIKPFSCGRTRKGNRWVHEDIEFLKKANNNNHLSEEEVGPARWNLPLAPYRAARVEKRPIPFERIQHSLRQVQKRYSTLILEGVGGLHCPLTSRLTLADWAKKEQLSVLLVARLGLGTLNHTLMTLEVAKRRGIMVKGIILNDYPKVTSDLSRRWNPQDLKELTHVPILGIFPYLKKRTVEAARQAWEKNFDIKRIRKIIKT